MDGFCFGKTKYKTKAQAIDRISQQKGNRRRHRRSTGWDRHMKLMPYLCSKCHHWHVGTGIREVAKHWDRVKGRKEDHHVR